MCGCSVFVVSYMDRDVRLGICNAISMRSHIHRRASASPPLWKFLILHNEDWYSARLVVVVLTHADDLPFVLFVYSPRLFLIFLLQDHRFRRP
jgi:hypothetical protein